MDIPYLRCLVAAGESEKIALRRKNSGINGIRIRLHYGPFLERLDIPYARLAAFAGGSDRFAVRRERRAVNGAFMTMERPRMGAC